MSARKTTAKPYRTLRERLTPAQRTRATALADDMSAALRLPELRRARQLTQEQLAEELGDSQPGVSQLERRADMYVSTLRRYIEAMGGELEIVARFPDGAAVRIEQFADPERDRRR